MIGLRDFRLRKLPVLLLLLELSIPLLENPLTAWADPVRFLGSLSTLVLIVHDEISAVCF